MADAYRDLDIARANLARSCSVVAEATPVGRAAEALMDLAARRKADVIDVGSREPSRVRKFLLGSTANMLVREASQSVLVVR